VPDEQIDISALFTFQAGQAEGRSPQYAELCRRLADDPRVGALFETPPRWDAPLRLLSGLHFLVLRGDIGWDGAVDAIGTHYGFLREFVATRSVQTNEVQRCWMLLPCFLEVARRTAASVLDVIELGSSAGLNLGWPDYRYRYAEGEWGAPDARLALEGEERGIVPAALLSTPITVRDRTGIEISPIDVTDPDGATLLKSFVWPDQAWRFEQLDRAIATTRDNPPPIIVGDLVTLLPDLLARRRHDGLTVVWETAALSYLPEERRRAVRECLEQAGETQQVAFVTTGRADNGDETCYGMNVRIWPDGQRVQVARADFHGRWIDWLVP